MDWSLRGVHWVLFFSDREPSSGRAHSGNPVSEFTMAEGPAPVLGDFTGPNHFDSSGAERRARVNPIANFADEGTRRVLLVRSLSTQLDFHTGS